MLSRISPLAKEATKLALANPRRPSMGFAPENQVRTGLPAGGRRIRNSSSAPNQQRLASHRTAPLSASMRLLALSLRRSASLARLETSQDPGDLIVESLLSLLPIDRIVLAAVRRRHFPAHARLGVIDCPSDALPIISARLDVCFSIEGGPRSGRVSTA
jgi:hypothetical protein